MPPSPRVRFHERTSNISAASGWLAASGGNTPLEFIHVLWGWKSSHLYLRHTALGVNCNCRVKCCVVLFNPRCLAPVCVHVVESPLGSIGISRRIFACRRSEWRLISQLYQATACSGRVVLYYTRRIEDDYCGGCRVIPPKTCPTQRHPNWDSNIRKVGKYGTSRAFQPRRCCNLLLGCHTYSKTPSTIGGMGR